MTGSLNTAVGADSLLNNDSGSSNTGVGWGALKDNRSGINNVAVGSQAMPLGRGSFNTLVGSGSAFFMASGDRNIIVGFQAAMGIDHGDDNIFLGASPAVFAESAHIRIGTPGTQTATFIAGIRGTTTALNDALPVVIDSAGQLGTISPTVMANVPVMVLIELQNMKRRAEAAEAGLWALEQRMAKLEAAGARAER